MKRLFRKEPRIDMRDLPISDCQDDLLEIDTYATALAEFIGNVHTPITISLQGEWGSGKTSLMKLLEQKLCKEEKEEGFECIWINTWEFFLNGSQEEAIQNVILEITKEIVSVAKQKSTGYKADINEIFEKFKNYTIHGANVVMSIFGADEESRKNLLNSLDINSITIIKDLRRSLQSLIAKLVRDPDNQVSNKGFIIFIDDLDRIDPEVGVKLLEVFKNIFDVDNCVFVIAIDYDVIVKGLKRRYGEYNDDTELYFKQYFDKLVQLPFVMPIDNYNIETIIRNSLNQVGYISPDEELTESIIKKITYVINASIGNNPRRIKRLINALHLSIIYDRSKTNILNNLENKVLNLIFVCLEQSYPELYSMLVKMPNYKTWQLNDFPDLMDNNTTDLDLLYQNYADEKWKQVICKVCLKNTYLKSRLPRIITIFEIVSQSVPYSDNQYLLIREILSLSKLTSISFSHDNRLYYDGHTYDRSSQTQFNQGNKLLGQIQLRKDIHILDVGCGNGKVTIELFNKQPSVTIDAFDLSDSQIEMAIKNRIDSDISIENINFFVADALKYNTKKRYDLIFSNATLHWIVESRKMYEKLYHLLKKGGQLAVHQGGHRSYFGLHDAVKQAIKNLGYDKYFDGWIYPIYYPTKAEMEKLLYDIGFKSIKVISDESDGKEHPDLVENFANASLLPYLDRMPEQKRELLKNEYMNLCTNGEIDTYTHRLYIFAERKREDVDI